MAEMHTVDRAPLSDHWNLLAPDGYDVVIIGSGYGGRRRLWMHPIRSAAPGQFLNKL